MDTNDLVVILAFFVGLILGLILGILVSRIINKNPLVPIAQAICGAIFVGINIYGVVYGVDIPHIFNFMMAMAFGGTLGIDIVKYFPLFQNLGKK